MSHLAPETDRSAASRADDIRRRYLQLKERQPNIRARNAAEMLAISEGALLAARMGDTATRLADEPEAILKTVYGLGEVMALTRNAHCVHERKGVYDNASFFQHGAMKQGLFLNPDIDLRLFMNHWKFCFAVEETSGDGVRKSLQFFDQSGEAVHKIYLTERSDESAYEKLIAEYRAEQQMPFIEVEPFAAKPADLPDDQIDWQSFRTEWENLKDTHDFFFLLRKFKVGRVQALRKIGSDFAYAVNNNACRQVLELARDRHCEIMIFVGNRGCIQIHTGEVAQLVARGAWYNVLDPKFNLHLREDKIAESWITKKPTEDGIVTALELFDDAGELIATLFGKRKPGIAELDLWRELVSAIPQK